MTMDNISIGIDVGSRSMEFIVLRGNEVIYKHREETSFDYLNQVKALLKNHWGYPILVTGYGRHLVSSEIDIEHVTEIRAHATGIHHLFPKVNTILDIGGQDTKAIAMDRDGRVMRFEMNDRCAAGTGKFLEVMAQALGCQVAELSDMALKGLDTVTLSSMCTVFVETEVVALRARGASPPDVARALVKMVAKKSHTMLQRVGIHGQLAFCGGVAKNRAVVQEIERLIGAKVLIPPDPEFTGALGAALIANKTA